jgi:hypothetical protein
MRVIFFERYLSVNLKVNKKFSCSHYFYLYVVHTHTGSSTSLYSVEYMCVHLYYTLPDWM